MIGTPDSKFVEATRKFGNAYGPSATPVTVMKSTPPVNSTSRTYGRFTEVGSATISWCTAVR